MRLGVRGKLFLVSLALIGTFGLASGVYLETELRSSIRQQLEEELLRHARSMREALKEAGNPVTLEEVDTIADRFGAALDRRVTVVARDGTVLGDSKLTLEQLRRVDNHANRPEIREGRESGQGIATRYSTTVRTEMLYVAVPHPARDAVVRVSMPLSVVDEAVRRLRALLLLGAAIGLLVAMLMSGLASHLASRTVHGLVEHARNLAREHGTQPPPSTGDEFGTLAGSMNQLATELDRTVSALARERDRLQTVLQSMEDAVVTIDADQHIDLVNAAAESLLGISRRHESQPLVEATRIPELVDLARRGRHETASTEFRLHGSQRSVMAAASPLRASGGTVIVLHDVTEMRRLETIRRDFVANVSHELRTPVSVIRANSETLLDVGLDNLEQATRFVSAIHRNSERLTALIADLLDLSRIETGAYTLEIMELDAAQALLRSLESLRSAAQRRNIRLQLEVPQPLTIVADPKALDQVLVNLIDNAVKYTDEGGAIRITATADAECARVEVVDDGPGIPERHRARVFERFYRVDEGRSRELGGTGLGLAIVKHLVQAMGGDVGVEPADHRGAAFWFTLRLAPPSSDRG